MNCSVWLQLRDATVRFEGAEALGGCLLHFAHCLITATMKPQLASHRPAAQRRPKLISATKPPEHTAKSAREEIFGLHRVTSVRVRPSEAPAQQSGFLAQLLQSKERLLVQSTHASGASFQSQGAARRASAGRARVADVASAAQLASARSKRALRAFHARIKAQLDGFRNDIAASCLYYTPLTAELRCGRPGPLVARSRLTLAAAPSSDVIHECTSEGHLHSFSLGDPDEVRLPSSTPPPLSPSPPPGPASHGRVQASVLPVRG